MAADSIVQGSTDTPLIDLAIGRYFDDALRRTARDGGQTIAYLMPGVIGAVTQCSGEWRRVAVGGRVGWVATSSLFGGDCAGLSATIRP